MKINLDSPADEGQVQIVPLIDVIFCILVFFILAVLQFQRPQGISVDLPKASTATVQLSERLIITLEPNGLLYAGSDPIDRALLQITVEQYLQLNPEGLVVLNAAQEAPYRNVIEVLDLLRQSTNRVALATNPTASPPPTGIDPNQIPTASPSLPPELLLTPTPTVSPTPSLDPNLDPNLNPTEAPVLPDATPAPNGSPDPAIAPDPESPSP
ncbi:MAG: biopolymer transporter ExbD [Synechococcales bacterium]|nr:biopolymer transporter ExbD [Synechococcales bacterium]